MNNDINLKELWQNNSSDKPNIDELFARARQTERKSKHKATLLAIVMAATFLYMIFIWRFSAMALTTSKIGMSLVLAALIIICIKKLQFIRTLNRTDTNIDNKKFLQQLLIIKKEQDGDQRWTIAVYFVLLFAGIMLFLIEPTMRMKTIWKIITYSLTIAWSLFGWFYLRKRRIKKQGKDLDKIIAQLKETEVN